MVSVYQYHAGNGALLYVGVTDRGIRRLHEHAESKPWWHLTTGCAIEHYETREDALKREADLIRTFRPPYNQQHNPERSLPIEKRAATVGGSSPQAPKIKWYEPRRQSEPSLRRLQGGSPKRRRAEWYVLTPAQRALTACVECGERPGLRGPSCIICLQQRKHSSIPAPSHA